MSTLYGRERAEEARHRQMEDRLCEYCEQVFTPENKNHYAHAEDVLCVEALKKEVARLKEMLRTAQARLP